MEVINSSTSYGIDITGAWAQMKNASISKASDGSGAVDAGLVRLNVGGKWYQQAAAELIGKDVTGLTMSQNSRWEHTAPCTINVISSAPSTSGIWAVSNSGGSWTQSANMHISADSANGVILKESGSWKQEARLVVTARVTVGDNSQWLVKEEASFGLTSSIGVKLSTASAVWDQRKDISFNVGTGSIGVVNSAGGSWLQAQGVSTFSVTGASGVGISCNRSSACCTQIQQSLLSTPNKLSFLLSNRLARQDDCAVPPSPSPIGSIAPITLNTSATFDETAPTVAIVARASTSSPDVGVQLSLTGLQLGSNDTDVAGLNVTRTVTNTTTTDPSGNATTTSTFTYVSQVDDTLSLAQSYAYFAQAQEMSFASVNFTVRAGSVKWSINITVSANSSSSNKSAAANVQANGFTLRYRLADITTAVGSSASGQIYKRDDTPQAGMTTFLFTVSSGKAVGQAEVLNVALLDGQVTPLAGILLFFDDGSSGSGSATTNGSYVLQLSFPPFNRSVVYDPSLGLGALLGRSSSGDGGSSTDLGLIVGVAVAVPVAVALVVVVIGAAVGVTWWRKRKLNASRGDSINFDEEHEHEQL